MDVSVLLCSSLSTYYNHYISSTHESWDVFIIRFTDKEENEPPKMETSYSNQENGSEGAGTKDRSFQFQNCMLATPLH